MRARGDRGGRAGHVMCGDVTATKLKAGRRDILQRRWRGEGDVVQGVM